MRAFLTKRNDQLYIQHRILAMMPGERKRLGISKSELWYQRKKIAEGKTIKIYDKVLAKIT